MQTFINSENEAEYIVKVKSRNYKWLWLLLLLLLPLLLLLRFSKDVAFVASDLDSKNVLQDVNVDFKYVDHSFIKLNPFGFLVSDTVKLDGKTDKDGKLVFTKVNYSLYSVLFHSAENAVVMASKGCQASDTLTPFFTSLQEIFPYEILLGRPKTSLTFLVVDKEDNEPLPYAMVKVLVEGQEFEAQTISNGMAEIKNLPGCSNLRVDGSKEGFLSDSLIADIGTFIENSDNRVLKLVPRKGLVSFIVKDLETDKTISGASAKLVLNSETSDLTVNTNGVGKGFFENVSAKYDFSIVVSKMSYFDTSSAVFKLTEYEKLTDEEKVIKMRPCKNSVVFRDIDSLSGKPIENVANKIFINGVEKGVAVSDGKGCFTVGNIGQDDEIKLVATKSGMKTKTWKSTGKKIAAGKQSARDIKLQYERILPSKPNPAKHCGVHFSGTLLSDTEIQGHISKIYSPDIYGEYVGEGRYISNQAAFPKAVQYTFDAIAVDKNTRLIIYSEPDFKGKILLDVKGPCLINNVKWKDEARIKDVCSKTFSPDLEANYPKSCRKWSDSNMNTWDFGSCVITCD
ncbi:MAG: hypothetical protein II956_06610 [Bacteroidales bacterium]|nr:hypothetical protein [Bacteroidales bacterium]